MARNEAKIRFTAETGEFNKEIKQSNTEMAKLREEMKLNAEQMKDTGTTVEGLQKKQQLLAGQLEATRAKTEAMSQKVEKAKQIFGENSEEVRKLETQLIKQQTAQVKLERAVADCAAELEAQADAAKKSKTETEKLTSTIDEQQNVLNDLKDEYTDAVLTYGKNSREAKDLAKEISKLSGELKESKSKMSAAESAADKLDKSLDGVGDGAEGAGGGFTVMTGALADLVSSGIQAAIGKINEFVDYMWSLPEATREIRQDFATLETAFDNVGFSSEQAKTTWQQLYGVFGEDDRAVETANNIARMAKSQQDLTDWVNITTGVWGTYQDSLPVEALAESAGETAKTGKVTGNLADALNWSSEAASMFSKYMSEDVVTAEDAFNEALAECNTEQERQQLITETLTKLYGGAAETYRETSGAMMEAKEATAEQILAENNLANALEPATTAWQDMKSELLVGVLPVVEKVSEWGKGALEWMKEHPVAMKVIAGVIGVVAAALTALTTVVTVYTIAQWAMNSAILANPLTWIIVGIVAAIAAVVAIVILLIEYWDEVVAAVKRCVQWICDAWNGFVTWIDTNLIQPIVGFFTGLWQSIVGVFQSVVEWVKTNWQSIVLFLINPFAGIFKYLWDNCEVFRNFLIGVGQWIYDNVIAPVVQFFVDLWNGIVNAYHTVVDPWIEIVKRISAIIYESVIQPVAQFFVDLWNGITSGLQAAWNWIVNLALTVAGWVNENVIQPVVTFFTDLWTSITTGVSTAVKWVKDVFATIKGWVHEKVIQPVTGFFTNLWNGFTNGARKAWEGVKSVFSAVGGFFSKVFGVVKDKIVSVFQAGGKVFNGIKEGIVSVFETVVNGLIKGINSVIAVPFKGLNSILDTIHNVTIVGVQPFSWLTWRAPIPKIPLLAEGGILTSPTLNIAGEAGPEAVIPLDRLQSFIDTAVDRALQMNNLQSLVNAVEDLANRAIELNINGHRFATATASDTDRVNGSRMALTKMGLAL